MLEQNNIDLDINRRETFAEAGNNNGWTPLHRAVYGADDERIKWLIANGAKVVKDAEGRYPHQVTTWEKLANNPGYQTRRKIIEELVNPNHVENSGYRWTALHRAVYGADEERVKWLIANGAKVVKDTEGRYPHQVTTWEKLANNPDYQTRRKIVEELVNPNHDRNCYEINPYNKSLCASDRNAYATIFNGKKFSGELKSFPDFLLNNAGEDIKNMLLAEQEMFKNGFRVIYHVCNRGNFRGNPFFNANNQTYIHPLFLYQLFGVLNAVEQGILINSPQFIPFVPKYPDKKAMEKIPDRNSFIELIKTSIDGDCDLDVRKVGLVSVAALSGCYHGETGGVISGFYIKSQPMNFVPHPKKIILDVLHEVFAVEQEGKIFEVVAEKLLSLARMFHKINSALLQIFLKEEDFLNHVCFAKNGGVGIQPIDSSAIEKGKLLENGTQLNVYLPKNLVNDNKRYSVKLYTRCQGGIFPSEDLIKFRESVVEIINEHHLKLRSSNDRSNIVKANSTVFPEDQKNWGRLSNRTISKYAFCFFDTSTLKITSVASRNSYIISKEIKAEREGRNFSLAGK